MIVKNESNVIRLLESVYKYIDNIAFVTREALTIRQN